jgi:hypothetical protein
LEGVSNADAVALRVVDHHTSESIYKQIASFPEIRPFDFLLTNAPGLDDTYWNWGSRSGPGLEGFRQFGDWVNGGVWGTVEGRAILMYYRLGKFEDIRRSAARAMRWAKDFRMDAPWSQQGENSSNPWSDTGKFHVDGVAVMIDNFAIPAATIRGLFDLDYRSDRLILRPRIPGSISYYAQKQPVRFGQKQIFLSCRNGGPVVQRVELNGKAVPLTSPEEVVLMYNELPVDSKVEITTEGGWPEEPVTAEYPSAPALVPAKGSKEQLSGAMPDSLKKQLAVLTEMKQLLEGEQNAEYEKAFVDAAIKSFQDCTVRMTMDPGPGYYRTITAERREGIIKMYGRAALAMYAGFANRMKKYAAGGDLQQAYIASLFARVQK